MQCYPILLWIKMASYRRVLVLVSVFLFFSSSLGIPVHGGVRTDKPKRKDALNENIVGLDEEEYKRYVEELRRMNAKKFEELKDKTPDEVVRTVDRKMAYTDEDVRSRLEEAKRQVVEHLRSLGRLRQLKDDNLPISDHELQSLSLQGVSKDITKEDLDKLMHEKVQVLQALDSRRKDLFKQHEMGIEAQRRQKLKKMTERDRLKAEEEFRKEAEARKAHQMPHPGGKEQLEDVWEKEDEMEREDFEPKNFFLMHDTNNDRFLDPIELEALFFKEVNEIYGEDRDQTEIREEMARMREHVLEEIDTNQDGMISLKEFLRYTEGPHFEDKEWEGLDNGDELFSDQEFDDYMQDYGNDDYGYHDDNVGGEDSEEAGDHHMQGDPGATVHHEEQQEQQLADETHEEQHPTEGTHEGGAPAEHKQQPIVEEEVHTQEEPSHAAAADHPEAQPAEDTHNPPAAQEQPTEQQEGQQQPHDQVQEHQAV